MGYFSKQSLLPISGALKNLSALSSFANISLYRQFLESKKTTEFTFTYSQIVKLLYLGPESLGK